MEFKDPYQNIPENTYTNPGTEELREYMEDYDKQGRRYLKEVGKTNIYNLIQSHKEETQVYNILEKYEKTNDENLINKRNGAYGDFTNTPRTQMEVLNTINKANNVFAGLDIEVRKEFNNSPEEFKASILNGTFEGKMQKFVKKPEAKEEQEQKLQNDILQNQTKLEGVNLNE